MERAYLLEVLHNLTFHQLIIFFIHDIAVNFDAHLVGGFKLFWDFGRNLQRDHLHFLLKANVRLGGEPRNLGGGG